MDGEAADPAAWLRVQAEGDLEGYRAVLARLEPVMAACEGEPLHIASSLETMWTQYVDARDHIADCEAKLAILDEHYILTCGDTNPDYEEFSVVKIGGANKDSGCVTCHYYGQGGVKGYGICRTVRLLLGAYRHRSGYDEKWGAALT